MCMTKLKPDGIMILQKNFFLLSWATSFAWYLINCIISSNKCQKNEDL